MNSDLEKLINQWEQRSLAWRESAAIAHQAGEIAIASRNYARSHTLDDCVSELKKITDYYQEEV